MSGWDNTSWTTRSSSATSNTLGANDYYLLLNTLTGATAVTLPAAGSTTYPAGRMFWVYKDASAQTVTITPASGTVDGGASTTLASAAVHCKAFINDGTNWFTVAAY